MDVNEQIARYNKALETNFDFMWKALVQTVDLLAKGATFYFTVLGLVAGFIFTQKLPTQTMLTLVTTCVVISILFGIIAIAFAYGVITGLLQLKKALHAIHPAAYDVLSMEAFFRRGLIVTAVAVMCCLAILMAIAISLLSRI